MVPGASVCKSDESENILFRPCSTKMNAEMLCNKIGYDVKG